MAEEARDPGRDVPRAIGAVAVAVFAIYAFLPAVALSAMPVHEVPFANGNTDATYTSALAGVYAGDPVAGIVQNLGLGALTTPVAYYVGLLAATILIIATNAGIIGVSRLTYSMGVLPPVPGRAAHGPPDLPHAVGRDPGLHGRGDRADAAQPAYVPGQPLRLRRDALVHDRARGRDRPAPAQAGSRPAVPRAVQPEVRGRKCAALRHRSAASARSARSVVTCYLFPTVRYAGILWMTLGIITLRDLPAPAGPAAAQTVIAEPQDRPAGDRDRVHRSRAAHHGRAGRPTRPTVAALKLASERGSRIIAVYPDRGAACSSALDAAPPELERSRGPAAVRGRGARRVLRRARLRAIVRTRNAGRALIDEAVARGSEVIVLGTPGRSPARARRSDRSPTTCCAHASCKVMIGATPERRGPVRAPVEPAARRERPHRLTAAARRSMGIAPIADRRCLAIVRTRPPGPPARPSATAGRRPARGRRAPPRDPAQDRRWRGAIQASSACSAPDAVAAIVYGDDLVVARTSRWALSRSGRSTYAGRAARRRAALRPGGDRLRRGGPARSPSRAARGRARRAFGDAAGFLIGWVVLLDFAVVIAPRAALRASLRGGGASATWTRRQPARRSTSRSAWSCSPRSGTCAGGLGLRLLA